jgi:hypothetical protein
MNHFWEKCFWDNVPCGQSPRCGKGKFARRCCENAGAFICFIVVFIFTGVSVGLSLALLTLLPITNAIDDAPNRLYVIYQASVTFFAALIAFQVIFRHNNSPFAFLIKARQTCNNKELDDICNDKNWMDKSEKEREIYLIQKVILNTARRKDDDPTSTDESDVD